MPPEPDRRPFHTQASEHNSVVALLPVSLTLGYYLLPASLQADRFVQFAPQILAYLALLYWTSSNTEIRSRLGLGKGTLAQGLRWGSVTGLSLGCLNTFIILSVFPSFGYDITFLKTTPHGRLPPFVMVPWFTCCIAFAIELNFRGFLLGRLAGIESRWWPGGESPRLPLLALLTSTMTFTFDPFMVDTFRHLHWIALWDGLIWGTIRIRTGNLYATIVAHAVEVMIMYLAVRAAIV